MSKVNIKSCFNSRWGTQGRIVEMDFSQLEVIGAAFVSGDSMMKKDILDGKDSHCQAAAWMNPEFTYEEILEGYKSEHPVLTKLRKEAKGPNFSLQYGSGAKGMHETYGAPLEKCKMLIDRYYQRYSVLKKFQDSIMEEVQNSRKPSGQTATNGFPAGIGEYISITGRRYKFIEKSAPKFMQDKGIMTSFSPTETKNYFSQGFSTGDVVPEVLGQVHKERAKDDILWKFFLPINTIHDSIIFDVHECALTGIPIIRKTMEDAPRWMFERYGIQIDLPMKVDVEVGSTWDTTHTWKE